MNVINMLVNFQNDKCNIKREILDQKLKVKKLVLRVFFCVGIKAQRKGKNTHSVIRA